MKRVVVVVSVAVTIVLAIPLAMASARRSQVGIALATARAMSPKAIKHYENSGYVEAFGSYRITVPKSWAVVHPDSALCDWPAPGTPQLSIVKADLPVPSCGAAAVRTVNDGAILFWPDAASPEPATERPLLTLRPRTTAPSRVYAVAGEPNQLLVRFREGAATFDIAVAVGRDGRVAGRVIASILWNPDT
jgi:hypothetical protein